MDNKDPLFFPKLVAEAQANAKPYHPGDVISCLDTVKLQTARTKLQVAARQYLVAVSDALEEVEARAVLDHDYEFQAEYTEHATEFRDTLALQMLHDTLALVRKEEEG